MLKEKRQWFELLFVTTDLIVVSCAWLLAYWLRFMTDLMPIDKGIPAFGHYLSLLLFIWIIWAFIYKRMGLYRPMRGVRSAKELWLLVNANFLGVLVLIVVTFLFREKDVPYSRLVFVYFGIISTVLTIAQRLVLRSFLREVRRRGYNLRYLLIVGAGQVAGDLATRMRYNRELGIQLVGCLSKDGREDQGEEGIPVLGSYRDLSRILAELDIDQVVIALPLDDNEWLPVIMEQIGDALVDVRIVPDLYRFVTLGGSIEEFEGLPIISLRESPLYGINSVTKRIFDVCLALVLLLLFGPVMLLIALLIKLTSSGPIVYKQERVSFDGTPFSILKFRTMRLDAESAGPGWTQPGDQRVTPLGAWLRCTSLDELPQLINVLRGDMSVVGPRPERPVYIKEFRSRIPRYMLRHRVPAGMTGWAQVNGWRGDTSIDNRIECDLYYIENWSVLFDLKILFYTVLRGFSNRNAY